MANIEIKYGQVWQDCRNVLVPRYVLVTDVSDTQVSYLDLKSGRRVSLCKTSMRSGAKGYSLVTDAKILAHVQATYGSLPPVVWQAIPATDIGPDWPWRKALPLTEQQILHYVLRGMRQEDSQHFITGMLKYYDEKKPDGAAVKNAK